MAFAALSIDLMWSSLPPGIAASAARASPVFPRFWSLYTPFSDSLSSAAPFSRAVGAAAAEEEENEEEEEEDDEEEEEEEAGAAGAATPTAESTTPSPTSSRSRIVRIPLCMVSMMRSASSSSLRSESSAFISERMLASAWERNSIVWCWPVM